jgi:cytochrome c-type biogenesis protein CcmH
MMKAVTTRFFAPLIRRFTPPSPRWGEETRGGHCAKLLLAIFLLLSPLPAFAVLPDEILKDPVLEQRARDLSAQLRCMVCQNQSIDDSNAELARDLRVLVRERLVSGDSDEAVVDYVVSRYGEFVLLKPRVSLRTLLLWGAPVLLLVIGATAMLVFARKRALLPEGQKLSADEEARIRDLLEK